MRWMFSLLCVTGCSLIVGTEERVLRDGGGLADANKEADAAIVDAAIVDASPCDGKGCAAQAQCNNACKTELADCEKQCKGGQDSTCKQDCASAAQMCEQSCGPPCLPCD